MQNRKSSDAVHERRLMRHSFRVTNGKIESDEEGVVQQIVDGLRLYRIPIWRIRERIPGEGAPSEAGIPDLMGWCFRKGKTAAMSEDQVVPLFIEVKRPGRHQKRPAQITFIDQAKAAGCVALFAQDFDDVLYELRIQGFL